MSLIEIYSYERFLAAEQSESMGRLRTGNHFDVASLQIVPRRIRLDSTIPAAQIQIRIEKET